jgi:hypothetical protein
METEQELLQLIRAAMKNPKGTKQPVKPERGKGPQHTRIKPLEQSPEYGRRGDFSRSNSNPVSRSIPTVAVVGYEEVPKTRFTSKHKDNPQLLQAETEMIRKAVRIALNNTGGAPSKRAAKQMASPKMTRSDRVFAAGKGCGPGSSKSPAIDAIKAIAATETGCIVRKEPIKLNVSQKNANTTQGGYFPQIVE